MNTNTTRNVDFDTLVRRMRMERSAAIGSAIADLAAGAWRGIAKLAETISHGLQREASPDDSRA